MRHILRLLVASIAVAAFAAPPVVRAETFKIDNVHSVASFQIRHLFSKVPGRFNEMRGMIEYDSKNLANSSVEVSITTASINTENERRDGHLRSADFFDAENHPAITFKSTKVIPGDAPEKFKIEGNLTMRGVTKKVTLDVTQLGVGFLGRGVVGGWEATATVNRQDFGISYNRTFDKGGTLLGDDVSIYLMIEANEDLEAPAKPDTTKK